VEAFCFRNSSSIERFAKLFNQLEFISEKDVAHRTFHRDFLKNQERWYSNLFMLSGSFGNIPNPCRQRHRHQCQQQRKSDLCPV